MPSRYRSRYFGDVQVGKMTYNLSGNVINANSYDGFEEITDVTGEGSGQPLSIQKVRQTGGILNGPGSFGTVFDNYRCDALQNPASGFFNSFWEGVPGEPSLGTSATKLLAETNPSRPVVDLPIAVFELKDFPSMLRLEGDSFLRVAAHANLSYQFGWRPLLNDLSNLFDFHDQVSKRETELRNLFDSGLRRKRKVWSGVKGHTQSRWVQSDGALIAGSWTCSEAVEHKGFVKWFPTVLPPRSNAEMRSLARRAVLGLTVDLSTAWEAMPWSWLVDWCSNVGDFLASHRNIIPAEHGPIQMMRHVAFEAVSPFPNNPNVSEHKFWIEQKQRHIVSPTLSAHLPFLSARQLSILGSIGVTRRTPRS